MKLETSKNIMAITSIVAYGPDDSSKSRKKQILILKEILREGYKYRSIEV